MRFRLKAAPQICADGCGFALLNQGMQSERSDFRRRLLTFIRRLASLILTFRLSVRGKNCRDYSHHTFAAAADWDRRNSLLRGDRCRGFVGVDHIDHFHPFRMVMKTQQISILLHVLRIVELQLGRLSQ